MEGGCDAMKVGGGVEGVTVVKDNGNDPNTPPLHLSEALKASDVFIETGSVFEVSPEEGEELKEKTRTFFDDDAVINSLKLGAGNGVFSDDEEQSSSDDEGLEPFEKLAQKMEDVTGDGGVLKMELRSGIGGSIPSGASVVFHYSAYLQFCDEPFDSSHLRNKPERKVVDSGDLMQGLNVAIKTMRKGERASFLVGPKYAFGELGCLPRIPGNETILYEVNVESFVDRAAADAYEELDEGAQRDAVFKEKLEAARSYHRQGNEQYREGCLPAARSSYFRASWIMENARLQDKAEELQRGALLAKLRSNLAQVFLEMKEPAHACTQCKLGLGVSRGLSDDMKAKLHYRYGKAKAMLNDFTDARKEFRHAQRLKPNNPDISKELECLLQQQEKHVAKERFMYQRMFGTPTTVQHSSTSIHNPTPTSAQNHIPTSVAASPNAKQKSILPTNTPEFERLVEETIMRFALDPDVNELPFPNRLSEEEIAFIAAAAKAANMYIHFTRRGMDKFLKVFKKR